MKKRYVRTYKIKIKYKKNSKNKIKKLQVATDVRKVFEEFRYQKRCTTIFKKLTKSINKNCREIVILFFKNTLKIVTKLEKEEKTNETYDYLGKIGWGQFEATIVSKLGTKHETKYFKLCNIKIHIKSV